MVFSGTPIKLQLYSERSLFGPRHTGEYAQRLTITSTGRVWISRYSFDCDCKGRLSRREYRRIENAQELLDSVAALFSQPFEEDMAEDAGWWALTLTNGNGDRYEYEGMMEGETYSQLVEAVGCELVIAG